MHIKTNIRSIIIRKYLYGVFIICLLSCQTSLEDRFTLEAKEYTNRYCPKQIDDVVVLDSVVYRKAYENNNGTYSYYHSVNVNEQGVDTLKTHEKEIYDEFLNRINNTQDLKQIKDAGITIEYVFYSLDNNNQIFDFKFSKDIYK